MTKIEDLSINISDNDGNLRNIDEIIDELQYFYTGIKDDFSMNDHELYLQGGKAMLFSIIQYLQKIAS